MILQYDNVRWIACIFMSIIVSAHDNIYVFTDEKWLKIFTPHADILIYQKKKDAAHLPFSNKIYFSLNWNWIWFVTIETELNGDFFSIIPMQNLVNQLLLLSLNFFFSFCWGRERKLKQFEKCCYTFLSAVSGFFSVCLEFWQNHSWIHNTYMKAQDDRFLVCKLSMTSSEIFKFKKPKNQIIHIRFGSEEDTHTERERGRDRERDGEKVNRPRYMPLNI